MSAENYYHISPDPQGTGQFLVQNRFTSDDDEDAPPRTIPGRLFDSLEDAYEWANSQYAEYGVYVEKGCF